MNGIIYLEDGTVYTGEGFGHIGTNVGELVFNTSMIGYGEVLSNNSSAGHIVTMTYPIIGSYGIDRSKLNITGLNASGVIVKELSEDPSNYQSEQTLDGFLKELEIVGVKAVDTRQITKKIKSMGSMKCVISNESLSVSELEKLIAQADLSENYIEKCEVEKVHIAGSGERIAVLDFGASKDMIDVLIAKNCDVSIFPYGTKYEEINKIDPSGLFVGNGPGDPKKALVTIDIIKQFIDDKKAVFGVDLGHQLVALALGAETVKMKYGHRGGNHGVSDKNINKSYIVSQNHGFIVDEESAIKSDLLITHKNLNDDTVEGIAHSTLPVFSVQFHPEVETSFSDTEYLFNKFIENCKGVK